MYIFLHIYGAFWGWPRGEHMVYNKEWNQTWSLVGWLSTHGSLSTRTIRVFSRLSFTHSFFTFRNNGINLAISLFLKILPGIMHWHNATWHYILRHANLKSFRANWRQLVLLSTHSYYFGINSWPSSGLLSFWWMISCGWFNLLGREWIPDLER